MDVLLQVSVCLCLSLSVSVCLCLSLSACFAFCVLCFVFVLVCFCVCERVFVCVCVFVCLCVFLFLFLFLSLHVTRKRAREPHRRYTSFYSWHWQTGRVHHTTCAGRQALPGSCGQPATVGSHTHTLRRSARQRHLLFISFSFGRHGGVPPPFRASGSAPVRSGPVRDF